MKTLEFDNVVVQIVNVVEDVVPQGGCCSCFQFKHNVVAVRILASRVNLRAKEDLS